MAHPKISSTRLRMRWLMSFSGERAVVRQLASGVAKVWLIRAKGDAEARLLTCLDHLAEVLALALAVERDPILRAAVAGAVPAGPCLVAVSRLAWRESSWLALERDA